MCEFPQKDVQVDHIKPVVDPKKGFVDWNTYIDRLFCDKKNLAVLCKPCHLEKTQKEKTTSTSIKRLKQQAEPLSSKAS